jgi:hypothetical protein
MVGIWGCKKAISCNIITAMEPSSALGTRFVYVNKLADGAYFETVIVNAGYLLIGDGESRKNRSIYALSVSNDLRWNIDGDWMYARSFPEQTIDIPKRNLANYGAPCTGGGADIYYREFRSQRSIRVNGPIKDKLPNKQLWSMTGNEFFANGPPHKSREYPKTPGNKDQAQSSPDKPPLWTACALGFGSTPMLIWRLLNLDNERRFWGAALSGLGIAMMLGGMLLALTLGVPATLGWWI